MAREIRDKYSPLRCSITESRKLNAVSIGAETLFFRLVAACDDLAQYEGNPVVVACRLYALRIENGTVIPDQVTTWMGELEKVDLIRPYESGGHRYSVLVNPLKIHRSDVAWEVRYPLAPLACIETDPRSVRLRDEFVALIQSNPIQSNPREEGVSELVESWNSLGKPFGRILKMSKSRTGHANSRLADPWWADNWKTALDRMKISKFCRGENDRGWVADIEFFLRPDSLAKILEGKYDDRENRNHGRQGSRIGKAASTTEYPDGTRIQV